MREKVSHKIYKYTNKVNGKVYIGRTCTTLARRAKKDGVGYKHCTYFWRAIEKYGWENFEGEVIEDNLTAEEAAERELFYINEFDSTNKDKGYNIVDKDYLTYSDEHREKVSEGNKGQQMSQETRDKIRKALKGRKLPKEVCEKMGASRRGIPRPPEVREKLRQANLGRKLSEEHRRKLSEAKKGKYVGEKSPSWGRKMSEETKRKLREINTGRIPSEENRKKISERLSGKPTWNKGKKMSKDFCEKLKKNKWVGGKKVICIETGKEYESITKAAEETGVGFKNISCALNKGEKYTAGGFHWKYAVPKEDYKPGKPILCVETGEHYPSVSEASKCTGLKKSNIGMAACNGRTAGGYHWAYVNRD